MNSSEFNPIRYSIITEKNKREIVMLRGSGCKWRKCRFCDYHLDYSPNAIENYHMNQAVLANVTGQYKRLEVINSGSFLDLDEKTLCLIEQTCLEKQIQNLHFECHWIHHEEIQQIRKRFEGNGIHVHIKSGVESFDIDFRETVLWKGFGTATPSEIAEYFDEVCLLQGIHGQTIDSMKRDIETGLTYFERVCVNIMVENSMPIKPDPEVIKAFHDFVYPIYKDNERVDILFENTDFGVGGDAC